MSLPVPNFDYDDNNSDVLDPRSIDQLTDPERYTKLTFDNMMDLTDIKKNNPPHVRVFRLISATNRIFKQRIVYQGENGKQVFTRRTVFCVKWVCISSSSSCYSQAKAFQTSRCGT